MVGFEDDSEAGAGLPGGDRRSSKRAARAGEAEATAGPPRAGEAKRLSGDAAAPLLPLPLLLPPLESLPFLEDNPNKREKNSPLSFFAATLLESVAVGAAARASALLLLPPRIEEDDRGASLPDAAPRVAFSAATWVAEAGPQPEAAVKRHSKEGAGPPTCAPLPLPLLSLNALLLLTGAPLLDLLCCTQP